MARSKNSSFSISATRASSQDELYTEDDIRIAYSRQSASAHDRSLHVSFGLNFPVCYIFIEEESER